MAGTGNFFLDNEDLLFQFKNGLPWEEIINLVELGYTLPDGPKNQQEAFTFYEEALTAAGEFAAKEVAPRSQKIDGQKAAWLNGGQVEFCADLKAIYDGMRDMGLYGLTLPRELGGMNGALALYFITAELLARADSSVMTHYGFHGGMALSMMQYSAKEGTTIWQEGRFVKSRWDEEIRQIVAGQKCGCMVLTEPDAGSDLGNIKTRAVERDGQWRLTGEKIFITSGHGQYQFVLAKTEDEKVDPLKALSLFLVPRQLERDGKALDNVQITKMEEKLGQHGSATVSLFYENSLGELVGRRGQGFELMLLMMNSARIGVGFEAIGLCETASRAAKAYAAERKTMGKVIDQHELVAEKLLDMDTWIGGLRALAFDALGAQELALRLDLRLKSLPPGDPEGLSKLKSRQQKLAKRARRLTPLLKYAAAEKACDICRDAIQIHGGAGYINETGVHKLLRDALVLPIYEGTSQIQALMATKDHLNWTTRDPAGFLRRFTRARVLARTAATPLLRECYRAEAFTFRTTESIMLRIFGRKVKTEWESGLRGKEPSAMGRYLAKDFLRHWDAKADFSQGLLHAERLTRMLADVAICKVLSKQAERFPERRTLAERFVHKAALRVEALDREVEHSDDSVLESIAERQARA